MDEPDYGKRSRKTNSMINLYTGQCPGFGQKLQSKSKAGFILDG